MSTLRDLAIGAVLSGAITFGTTYYFTEQNRAAQAEQLWRAEQRSQTWEFYRRAQSDNLVAARETLSDAIVSRPDATIATWENGPGSTPEATSAMRELLRFYGDLGIAIRAGEIDRTLAADIFGANINWWTYRALPKLCVDYNVGENDRFDLAMRTFGDISTLPQSCDPMGELHSRRHRDISPSSAPP